MGAKPGNKNALKSKSGRKRKVIGISGYTLDLICDALALEGNVDPTGKDVKQAIAYAVRQVYGRKMEDQEILIL